MSVKVLIAMATYYLTADKTRAVKRGDPEATSLLVRKGGQIEPEAAEYYGIETEIGEAVSVVRNDISGVSQEDRLRGVGPEVKANYEIMETQRAVNADLRETLSRTGNAPASRQIEAIAQAKVNEAIGRPVNTAGQIVAEDPDAERGGAGDQEEAKPPSKQSRTRTVGTATAATKRGQGK